MKKLLLIALLLLPLSVQAKIVTRGIADDAVTTAKIADDAVTAALLAADSVDTSEVAENAIEADELSALYDTVILCGQLVDNNTVYVGPALGQHDGTGTDSSIGSTACDALDSTTEATADAPIGLANTSFKVTGMVCEVSSSGSNGVTVTLRSAAADTTPQISCSIPTTETSCTATTATTTDISANATVAVEAVTTEDLSLQDVWCRIGVAYK